MQLNEEKEFMSDSVTLNTSTWTEVGNLRMGSRDGSLAINGDVGAAGALTDFEIRFKASQNSRESVLLSGGDFATYPNAILVFASAGLSTTAASTSFKLILDCLKAVPYISFWAKGSATTLQIQGTVADDQR